MPKLTTQQQTDLQTWLKDTSKDLPESLKNIFIEDCLSFLNNSDHARDRFNSVLKLEIPKNTNDLLESNKEYQIIIIQTLLSCTRIEILTSYPGQKAYKNVAVMPFLDKKIKLPFGVGDLVIYTKDGEKRLRRINWAEDTNYFSISPLGTENDLSSAIIEYVKKEELSYYNKFWQKEMQLDHFLYREFTEALRVGKSFDEALQIITKIYIQNLYA